MSPCNNNITQQSGEDNNSPLHHALVIYDKVMELETAIGIIYYPYALFITHQLKTSIQRVLNFVAFCASRYCAILSALSLSKFGHLLLKLKQRKKRGTGRRGVCGQKNDRVTEEEGEGEKTEQRKGTTMQGVLLSEMVIRERSVNVRNKDHDILE
ncbi:hypothetical protein WR25_23440 [Diploscapter pachys]|uniref:Uncharacterized protein n=1 Tax=Diploscapter pachys TaxID=2018661 RepID=A0A2A2KQD5_9BILA|nr:hypothetical protein WR25_23440 [Diploscapter pachys]